MAEAGVPRSLVVEDAHTSSSLLIFVKLLAARILLEAHKLAAVVVRILSGDYNHRMVQVPLVPMNENFAGVLRLVRTRRMARAR